MYSAAMTPRTCSSAQKALVYRDAHVVGHQLEFRKVSIIFHGIHIVTTVMRIHSYFLHTMLREFNAYPLNPPPLTVLLYESVNVLAMVFVVD